MKEYSLSPLWRITAAMLLPIELLTVTPFPLLAVAGVMATSSANAENRPGGNPVPMKGIAIKHSSAEPLPDTSLHLSKTPTDAEIFALHVFSDPLVPIGRTTAEDNAAVAQAITDFCVSGHLEGLHHLQHYVDSHPKSPWRAAIELNLGTEYEDGGFYGKAFKSLYHSWVAARGATEEHQSSIAEAAFGKLATLYASLGSAQALQALLGEAKGRKIHGSASQMVRIAELELHGLLVRPDHGYNCGGIALDRLGKMLDKNRKTTAIFVDPPEGAIGYTLIDMQKVAAENSLQLRIVKREKGASFPMPSIIHWKVGHYSTLIERSGKSYLIRDTNVGHDRWISEEALDEETSGYALVPKNRSFIGWNEIAQTEARKVWGGCHPTAPNTDNCPQCEGGSGDSGGGCTGCGEGQSSDPTAMAQYSIQFALANLHIFDTPISYNAPYGPSVQIQVDYNHRDAAQPSTFNFSNFGKQWTFTWLSYVTDYNNSTTDASESIYLRGGGVRRFSFFSGSNVSSPNFEDYSVLTRVTTSPVRYERTFPDGSKEVYTFTNTSAPSNSPRNIFLTQLVDPQGNSVTINYDSNFRIIQIVDADGQTTTFAYGNSSDIYKVTQITDPFGRYAQFSYNTSGELSQITDPIGIISKFGYDGTFINSLTTPYGTTTFTEQKTITTATSYFHNVIEATDPLGAKERVELVMGDDVATVPTSEPAPSGIIQDTTPLDTRDCFYWNKKAMMDAPGDYTKAYAYRYLDDANFITIMSDVLGSEKPPLESRIYYNYPGQTSTTGYLTGTSSLPSLKARLLDDGSSQIYQYTYNSQGKPTQIIDPLGRETDYLYYSNGIDVNVVKQKKWF